MFRKVTGLHTGRTDLPLLQRDALIDPGTLGLFDFCHGWGFPEMVTPVAGNKNLQNYVRGGAPAINGPVDKAWALTSGIRIPNFDNAQQVVLPAAMVLPASSTHFAIGMFAKIDVVNTGGGARAGQIVGCRGATITQWGLNLVISSAGITGVQMAMCGKTFTPTPADVGYPNDGLMHHFVMEFVSTSSTNFVLQFYIDGTLVYVSSQQAWTAGSFPQPDAGTLPGIGKYAAASGTVNTMGVSVPRIWVQNLAAAGSKTITQMIAQDRTVNSARFV